MSIAISNRAFIIGSQNIFLAKYVFPLIVNEQLWIGNAIEFFEYNGSLKPFGNNYWFQNLQKKKKDNSFVIHTMEYNLKHNKKLISKLAEYGFTIYPHYDNYDAIEVPFLEAIPSDYSGIMGVPLTFLSKYNNQEWQIVGAVSSFASPQCYKHKNYNDYIGFYQNGKKTGRTGSTFGPTPVIRMNDRIHPYYKKDNVCVQMIYKRVFIRRKKTE